MRDLSAVASDGLNSPREVCISNKTSKSVSVLLITIWFHLIFTINRKKIMKSQISSSHLMLIAMASIKFPRGAAMKHYESWFFAISCMDLWHNFRLQQQLVLERKSSLMRWIFSPASSFFQIKHGKAFSCRQEKLLVG